MENIKIVRMTLEDAADIMNLDDTEWASMLFSEFIDDSNAYFFKATCGGEFAGYSAVYHNDINKGYFLKIMDLEVLPVFRRKGIGKALMHKIIEVSKEFGLDRIKLEVDTKNNEALKLYESLNFKTHETQSGFYDDGGDAYIMWRHDTIKA